MVARLWCFVLSLIFFSASYISPVLAHDESQPPFVSINYKSTVHSEIKTTSLSDFVLAHDTAPDTYIVNTPILFVMDKDKLLYDETIRNRNYEWDLGDGTRRKGTEFSHTYKQIGTYFLSIYAIGEKPEETILIFRALLHIVPDSHYELPKVHISIQNTDSKNGDSLDFSKEIILESYIDGGSAPVTTFYWDLGDGQTSNEPVVKHVYDQYHSGAHPIVRVRDSNGFIADATVSLENSNIHVDTEDDEVESKATNWTRNILAVGVGVIVISLIYIFKKKLIAKF
jgi:hypothetical protein